MRSIINISLESLLHNKHVLEQALHPNTQLTPVVKANAYGHGLKTCIRFLKFFQRLIVFSFSEAEELRSLGYEGRIICLCPLSQSSEFRKTQELRVEPAFSDLSILQEYLKQNLPIQPHIEIDTGMGRTGLPPQDIPPLLNLLSKTSPTKLGVFTHFSSTNGDPDDFTHIQMRNFENLVKELKKLPHKFEFHSSSSGSTLLYPNYGLDLCRTGIALWGLYPNAKIKLKSTQQHLKPALTWNAPIIQTKILPKGHYIGYNNTFKTTKQTKVGLIPVGYSDGLPLQLSSPRGHLGFQDKKLPILGRISMNLTTLDLSEAEHITTGTEIDIIGGIMTAEQLADWAGTINYEIIARLSQSLPRRLN
jgi:alanine racemase